MRIGCRARWIVRALALAAAVVATAHAGEVIISGGEEAQLVCRNVFKEGQLFVDDMTFDAGGLDKGLPGDADTIVLSKPSDYAKRQMLPDVLAAAVSVETPGPLTVQVGVWRQQAKWDYGVLGVYWNKKRIGTVNTNVGKKKELAAISLAVPADAVAKTNVLWVMPVVFHRRVYLDAIEVSGPTTLKLLGKADAQALLAKAGPGLAETRDLKARGKALVINEFALTTGLLEYEVLEPLHLEVARSRKWVPPSQWKDYALVMVHGRFKSKAGEGEAIGEYLANGGNLVMTAHFGQYFPMGKGTAWKDLPWTGGYRTGWSRHANPRDSYFGVVARKSPLLLPGMKPGMKLDWWGSGMTRFFNAQPAVNEVLVHVDSTAKPQKDQSALFIHRVGKGTLAGVCLTGEPELPIVLRNIVADLIGDP